MEQPQTTDILVVGAGPAGISAAWYLAKKGHRVLVVEKNGEVGGLGRSLAKGGAKFDLGPHTFHIRETRESREIHEDLGPFFGKNPHILERGTKILLEDKIYTYPLELNEVLPQIRKTLAFRIGWDYLWANSLNLFRKVDFRSFRDWGEKNLGKTLYDLCFGFYSEKVWGMNTAEISFKQAQRVAKLNLKSIVLRMLGFGHDPATYFKQYKYPRGGITVLFENVRKDLEKRKGKVLLHTRLLRYRVKNNRITHAVCQRGKKIFAISAKAFITTDTLGHTLQAQGNKNPEKILKSLRYRSLRLIFVFLRKERVTRYHWVYLLDRKFRINRISEQKNVSEEMVPPRQTVLCCELSCWRGDKFWNLSEKGIRQLVMQDLRRAFPGQIHERDLAALHVVNLENAYPVYVLNFERDLFRCLQKVHTYRNIFSLGRHGLYLNNSMDDNFILGKDLAGHIDAHGGDSGSRWLRHVIRYVKKRFEGK